MSENKELVKKEPTISERFVNQVITQFQAEVGAGVSFTDYERTLAQHLYIKVDASLKTLDTTRANDKPQIVWSNVNMTKLALDAVHRIQLGLDALMDNHLHVVAYLNTKTGKYDLDLRIGYKGQDFIRRTLALEKPVDIIYHLVHENDFFAAHMKSMKIPFDQYEFQINKPFERGEVVGGFGYIIYPDENKNKLVIVTKRDFNKSRNAAASQKFWAKDKYEQEMMYKTLVHRVAKQIQLDPQKINSATYAILENADIDMDERVIQELEVNANQQTIDVEPVENTQVPTNTTIDTAASLPDELPDEEIAALPNMPKRSGGPGF